MIVVLLIYAVINIFMTGYMTGRVYWPNYKKGEKFEAIVHFVLCLIFGFFTLVGIYVYAWYLSRNGKQECKNA